MVRARITTAAATTATEIQKMGARRTRCMMVVLVLRVGNPGGSPLHPSSGSPLHPSIRAPSEIGSRSCLPVCMGRHADHRNRGAPPRLPDLALPAPTSAATHPVVPWRRRRSRTAAATGHGQHQPSPPTSREGPHPDDPLARLPPIAGLHNQRRQAGSGPCRMTVWR